MNSWMILWIEFSKKATKNTELFIVDLTLCSKSQIDGEDFVDFFGLLRKHELWDKADFEISQKNHNNPFHGKNGWLIFFKQIFFAKLRKKHIELIGR